MKPLQGIFFRDWEQDYVGNILKEIFWERLYAPCVQDKKDLTIVDIGANIGLFTLWMYPYAKQIYSVEPSAMHIETLRKMIEFNKMDKVTVLPYALSHKDGTAEFTHNDNTTMFMLKDTSTGITGVHKDTETVHTRNFASLLKDIPHVDLLKVDVEGAEGTAFAGPAFDEVAPKIDQIVLEYHNWCGISVQLLMNTIRDRGFSVTQMQTQATVLWFKKQ